MIKLINIINEIKLLHSITHEMIDKLDTEIWGPDAPPNSSEEVYNLYKHKYNWNSSNPWDTWLYSITDKNTLKEIYKDLLKIKRKYSINEIKLYNNKINPITIQKLWQEILNIMLSPNSKPFEYLGGGVGFEQHVKNLIYSDNESKTWLGEKGLKNLYELSQEQLNLLYKEFNKFLKKLI